MIEIDFERFGRKMKLLGEIISLIGESTKSTKIVAAEKMRKEIIDGYQCYILDVTQDPSADIKPKTFWQQVTSKLDHLLNLGHSSHHNHNH